jgi:chromosome segregation ATPase
LPFIGATLVAFCFFGLAMYYRAIINATLRKVNSRSLKALVQEIDNLKKSTDRHTKSVRSIQDSLRLANEHKANALREKDGLQKRILELEALVPAHEHEKARLAAREEAWRTQVKVLQDAMSRESSRAVVETYVIFVGSFR